MSHVNPLGSGYTNPMTKFVDPDAVELELELVQPLDELDAALVSHPLDRLTPDDFERLLYALYKNQLPRQTTYDLVTLMITGADRGRDVWLTRAGKPVGLIQCKRTTGTTAPSALQEIIKYLLFSELDPRIAPDVDFVYTLAVSEEPTGATVDLFASPKAWFEANAARIVEALHVVIRDHVTFKHMSSSDLLEPVTAKLMNLSLKLLRPTDLNLMIDEAPGVQSRFFKTRMVSDNDFVSSLFRSYLGDRIPPQADQATEIEDEPETIRFLFREDSGFAGSDEELGIVAAEFALSRRANACSALKVDVVDDFDVKRRFNELNAKSALELEERRGRLILRQIVLRYQETERALTEQLTFLLTSREIGEVWFGGHDFESQGRAIRHLGHYYQAPYPSTVSALRLVLFPRIDRSYPTVYIDLDEAEREAFLRKNEVGDLPDGLSAINGFCAMDLLREVQVGKYAPALVHKLHVVARDEGRSISALVATIDEPLYGWTLGLA